MKNNKTRHICDLTFCRHINTENICTIGNRENCVYYRTLQALNGYKENAKWCDDCKKIKELEQKNHAMLVNSLKICNQSEIDNDENERKIAELEEKLANADYQLEGRDVTIKELEATNKKISNECHKLVDSLEKKQKEIAEYEKVCNKNMELADEIDKLEKENLYYKDVVETNTAEWEEQGQRVVALEKENAKAKEIIKEILEEDNYGLMLSKEMRLSTEQFLKDSEV